MVSVPPLIAVVPAAFVVMLANAVVLPIAPAKVVVPPVLTTRLLPPLIVLLNVTLPATALWVSTVRSLPNVTA